MKFSFYTTRWTTVGIEVLESYHKSNKPFIICLWHDRLMLAPCAWKWKKPLHVLASAHRDGRLIAKVVEAFSMPAVFGSTGKGVVATKELIHLLRSGECVAVIPDGPRGPRHKAAPGVIAIAKIAKVDIFSFSFCVKRYHRLASWDRFILAYPFNKGAVVYNMAISQEELSKMNEKDAVNRLENCINEASQEACKILYEYNT